MKWDVVDKKGREIGNGVARRTERERNGDFTAESVN